MDDGLARFLSPQSLLTGALGLALLFLALPRLLAAWWALPGDPYRVEVVVAGLTGRGEELPLEAFLESRRRALWWTPGDGRLWQELGFGLWQAGDLEAARGAFEEALRHRPVDGLSWFALAKLDHLAGRDREAVAALRLSLWTAPNHQALTWPRLLLMVELGPVAEELFR